MVKFVASLGLQVYILTELDAQNHRTSIGKDVLETVSKDVTKLIFNLGQQHRKHMM